MRTPQPRNPLNPPCQGDFLGAPSLIREGWGGFVRQAWRTVAQAAVIGLWWPGGDLEVRACDVIEP